MSSADFGSFLKVAQRLNSPFDEIICEKDGIPSSIESISSFSSRREVCKRTWKAFYRAIHERFTSREIEFIQDRYHFNWDRMYSGLPLQRRHVECFGLGAAVSANEFHLTHLLRKNILYWLCGYRLGDCDDEYIRRFIKQSTRDTYLGNVVDPAAIKGGPRSFLEHLKKDLFSLDQERCNLCLGIGKLVSRDPRIPKMHPWYQRLVMGIISKLDTDEKTKDIGYLIPCPGQIAGQVNYYKIYDIISYGGLSAIALTPASNDSPLPSILAFRCTQQALSGTDSILSVLNDLEKNIGRSGYFHSRKKLNELMENKEFLRGGKIKVLAYSLGGGHAGPFLKDHWKKVDEFVGFNFVGSDDQTVERLANTINQSSPHIPPPRFYIYRNKGDWVNKAGKKHIGWGIKHPLGFVQVSEFAIDDSPVPSENVYDFRQWGTWLDLHAVRALDPEGGERDYQYTVYRGSTLCDPILDTYKLDRRMEDARLILGNLFLRNILIFFTSIFDFVFRIFGIDFLRKNNLAYSEELDETNLE